MARQTTAIHKGRDRDATSRSILAAARLVLAEDGFQHFGINAIARRAGCDKQLIYRYYGGLEGLADAIGEALAEDLAEELKPLSALPAPTTYAELMTRLALGLIDLLRANRLMQQINAWESAAPSPLVARMGLARSRRMGLWMHQQRGTLTAPAGADVGALNALIIAGIQQLVLAASANGAFSGLPLRSDEDWTRVREAVSALIQGVYGQTA